MIIEDTTKPQNVYECERITVGSPTPWLNCGVGHRSLPFSAAWRGYITSTPKSADFSKKHRFWPKNERASCMPPPKFAERPYLAGPKTLSGTPILGLFSAQFCASQPIKHPQHIFFFFPISLLSIFHHVSLNP